MPRQAAVPKASGSCIHAKLSFSETSNAKKAGYVRPTPEQRLAATTPSGSTKTTSKSKILDLKTENPSTFPAPLVLPEDELSWDPTYPPQSLRAWIREKDRNKVTADKKTIYLVPSPEADLKVNFMEKWAIPKQKGAQKIKHPEMQHVRDYLEAFYFPLPVKLLPNSFMRFTDKIDDLEDIPNEEKREIIGLKANNHGHKGIRARPTPDGDFSHQLNLNDLLDAAIWSLPEDAYTLLMLVEHDIYEDEEDDFACGRAYGGSRIAVVSMARYHPILDEKQGVEREHGWPASHCEKYLSELCGEQQHRPLIRKQNEKPPVIVIDDSDSDIETISSVSPMQAAVSAHLSLPSLDANSSPTTLTGLWLGRVCRTASHELGHCFGIDHCIYFACSMQGTASIEEDGRQPPFLCPVDLVKVLRATDADMRERYSSLVSFCEKHPGVHLFAAYAAWIRHRVEGIDR